MLMQTDACLLMHAGEYWCVRHVVDVFVEPHLQINYIDFIYFIFGLYLQIVCGLYADAYRCMLIHGHAY